MTNKSNNDLQFENDVDLNNLLSRINNTINKMLYFIYKLINFFCKKIYYFITLIIISFSIGYYFDYKAQQISVNKILVIPNFNSVNYLYDRINNVNYIKSIFGDHFNSISIESSGNILDYLTNYNNLKVFDVINKNGALDIEKFANKETTTKNYKYHLITLKTSGLTKKQINESIDKFLYLLNSDKYFNSIKEIDLLNDINKKNELIKSIEKINIFFDRIGNQNSKSNFSLNTFDQINDLINSKQNFLNEINDIDLRLIERSKVIYEAYRIDNIKNTGMNFKFLFPILSLFGLYFFYFLKRIYLKLKRLN